jgi:hypothetical protein
MSRYVIIRRAWEYTQFWMVMELGCAEDRWIDLNAFDKLIYGISFDLEKNGQKTFSH